MSDVNFMNSYNEVVFDNLSSILKQNFLFQTQIKFLEERAALIPTLEEKGQLFDQVVQEKSELENKILSLNSDINNKNVIISNASKVDVDKHRLQSALNNQAKEIETLVKRIDAFQKEHQEQKDYIKQLEDMLPNSKRKKLGLETTETVEEVSTKTNVSKIQSDGGTF
jgi:hypothetical protein